jgi:hypothetical protein
VDRDVSALLAFGQPTMRAARMIKESRCVDFYPCWATVVAHGTP